MAQANLRLKKLDPEDIHEVLFATWVRNMSRKNFFDSSHILLDDSVRWHRTQKDRDFYLILAGKKWVGTIAVQHRKDCEFLQNLCIDPEFRGRGIAKWAIKQLMRPNRFIIAQVKLENKHVIKMYQELGFWRSNR